ncbi:MAG: phosphatase PAP2 family protein [Bacteroidia bacterium]|nr:phosphatase PAP2 family protein [Bacteroidia bacterium]
MNGFIQWLIQADTNLFLAVNGLHSTFLDTVMYWASNRWIWIPLYAWILFRLVKFDGKKIFRIILFVALLITASDQLSSSVIKKFVERPRPCHETSLEGKVHIVNNYCGGEFGFVSSHATNCFALLSFLFLLTRRKEKLMIKLLLAWAIIVSYSRIYLGVHYPGDVICGALLGIFLGGIFSMIYFRIGTKL